MPLYPFCPRTSQIMNVRSVTLPGDSIRRSFFVTFVPIVVMYSSENLSTTKRRIRLVLPTAPSPRRRILRLMWSSTIAVPLHAGATLITLAGSMSSLRIQGVLLEEIGGPDALGVGPCDAHLSAAAVLLRGG